MTDRNPRAMSDNIKSLSFEDALSELEKIVRGLEGGQLKLEDAITAYERGAALRQHCEAKLSEAEARVQAIVQRSDGTLNMKPMD
ncbi:MULTISPECIES: exodeoxyribonuclease VII small subunit [Acetobacter]|nr:MULTISPECIES: exodeoxyribonuclease VII small subunit [Acetobacter]BAU38578.1 exodeoxyribonuclease VII small subunit [Acetobacter pasteurianus NBRC 101655]GBR57979.1 exodeoxyribonuclease VII small subunit [Acetobacter senegalensis DSM 18889]ASL40442.1 exodeoxyribonuclease VII small subunit [Acetobacter oryzifermentans]ATI13203.1 exodeoxyribonuclease VII small subunit [Acetobacter pomorum]AXC26683.1 exodeoxyribonuclease VII small subunit [Acetobacter sp. JWB]